MRVALILWLIADWMMFTLAFPGHTENQELLVHTKSGGVRGKTVSLPDGRGEVFAFLGIPFAEPPLGDLRFRTPVPVKSWEGVRSATNFSNSCMQQSDTTYPGFSGSEMWNPNTAVSEDCLYLNVWTPSPRPHKATVMVWIFGGGFYSGTASLDVYDGKILAGVEDVIVVSMNYRVGTFGFLATGDDRAKGNYGMLDQLLALKWVKENIAAFGGDPQTVTIFGESAGADSVGLHLLSPLSRPYFVRAILQSGAPDNTWGFMDRKESKRRSAVLGETLGCSYSDPDFVDCLRKVPANTLSESEWITVNFNEFPWVPTVDGFFLPDEPKRLISERRLNPADLLLGANKDEGTWFILYQVPGYEKDSDSTQTYDSYLNNVDLVDFDLNACSRSAVKDRYTSWGKMYDKIANRDGLDDVVGDRQFLCPVVDFAHEYAKEDYNVYMYYFDHEASNKPWPEWMGVMHGDEIQYVFGCPLDPSMNYNDKEKDMAETMMSYWANFAKHGNPNKGKKVPHWPKQTSQNREYLIIPAYESATALRKDYCDLWSDLIPMLQEKTRW
ncbi:acetylcholinesterase-like isoform X2 [Ptychodera flava]|uniref:acetylcholinesterase-like isoform X2 n=1 Tax=Ptychodera flava TaxID=63121 RepID=UPI00396A4ADF